MLRLKLAQHAFLFKQNPPFTSPCSLLTVHSSLFTVYKLERLEKLENTIYCLQLTADCLLSPASCSLNIEYTY